MMPTTDVQTRLAAAAQNEWCNAALCRQTETVERGAFIFRAGVSAKDVFILRSGRVKIFQLNPKGKETLLWFCGPGEVFGISELCQGELRRVYAQASERSEIVTVDRAEFVRFLTSHPEKALALIDLLSSRLRSLGTFLESITTAEVAQRVTMLLRHLGTRYGRRAGDKVTIDMAITHQEMADMIGTTRQSVTMVLSELKRDGLLRCHKRRMEFAESLLTQTVAGAAARP